jgi:hypothetical protein
MRSAAWVLILLSVACSGGSGDGGIFDPADATSIPGTWSFAQGVPIEITSCDPMVSPGFFEPFPGTTVIDLQPSPHVESGFEGHSEDGSLIFALHVSGTDVVGSISYTLDIHPMNILTTGTLTSQGVTLDAHRVRYIPNSTVACLLSGTYVGTKIG